MEEFLKQMMGKKIDVSCGASSTVSGDVVDVKGGILYLRDDDDRVAYIAIERIAVIWESKDKDHEVRTGFITGKLK